MCDSAKSPLYIISRPRERVERTIKMACTNVDEFRKIHNHQLKGIGFPSELVQELFQQLSGEDGAKRDEDYFTVRDFKNSSKS